MTLIRLAIVLALLPSVALAQTRTYRDALGREVGRSTTSGNTTTFTNPLGQQTGRAVTSNGTTTIYDQMGRERSKITSKPQSK
jgi:YD repeat-containing protein